MSLSHGPALTMGQCLWALGQERFGVRDRKSGTRAQTPPWASPSLSFPICPQLAYLPPEGESARKAEGLVLLNAAVRLNSCAGGLTPGRTSTAAVGSDAGSVHCQAPDNGDFLRRELPQLSPGQCSPRMWLF